MGEFFDRPPRVELEKPEPPPSPRLQRSKAPRLEAPKPEPPPDVKLEPEGV